MTNVKTKTVVILSTDKFYHGIGGLCTQLQETIKAFDELKLPYFFWVVVPDKTAMSGPNFITIPIANLTHDLFTPFNEYLGAINMSGAYVAAVMNSVRMHGQVDLIHAFDWGTFTSAQLLSHYLKVPYIASIALSIQKEVAMYKKCDKSIVTMDQNFLHVFQVCCMIEANGLKYASQILFNTKTYSKLAGPFLSKTKVINNGVPYTKIQNIQVPKDFTIPGNANHKKLIFLGRLTLSKNILGVLESTLPPDVDLIIIGSDTQGFDPTIAETVRNAAKKRPDVIYVGAKYDDEKFWFLKKADAVIMPSLHEPFGIVALESLASGTILLSSFVDGMSEFLNQSVAIPCGTSPNEITEALIRWNCMTDCELDNLRRNGSELSKRFSWTNVAERTAKEVYETLVVSTN